jgi:CheY-like chemotaxis protein
MLHADAARVTQIFTNLLTNAARYTPRGGKITFAAVCDGKELEVSVTDTGIGIPADKLERILDMFTQVDRPAERSGGGLGIGLMLVKRLSEMHGGSVRAFSEGPGKGSRFSVRLPTSEAPPPPIPKPERLPTVTKQLRIVVADDMADAANSVAAILTTLGHDVRVASDGLEVVRLAEEFEPHVVLTDLSMPTMSGLEAARRIRSQPWGQSIKLIALTSWGQDTDKQRTAAAGFDHHLVKPVEVAVLQEVFEQSSHTLRK